MTPAERRERVWAASAGTILLALVLSPIATGRDSFPLSNYPMFANERSSTVANVYHLVAHSTAGAHRPVPPRLLGTEEIMQATQTARTASKEPVLAAELCQRVATAVGRAGPEWSDVDRLELRLDRYDAVLYWEGDRTPRETKVFARCPVTYVREVGR